MIDDLYDTYVAKYGKDNADYLMEAMGEWGKHYDRAVFIDMGWATVSAFEQNGAGTGRAARLALRAQSGRSAPAANC